MIEIVDSHGRKLGAFESEKAFVGVLVNEARLQDLEDENTRLRSENSNLQNMIRRLRQNLLGYILEAGNLQDIEPPGDFEDYPFSEN